MRRGDFGASVEAKQALGVANNARQMVINREQRIADLTTALAANTSLDQTTRTQLTSIAADVRTAQQADVAAASAIDHLHESLVAATAQLTASDVELAKRITDAEAALRNEATVRAAADAAEAKTRADAVAAEARARADADTANAALAAAAIKSEADARAAADASEAATRAAADTALAARATALENYMPAVTSGRASTGNLLMTAGSTRNVVVTFDTPATDTTYTPVAVLDVPDQANYTVVSITNRTTTSCTVTIKNRALLSLTATIGVTVIALKL
jgi:hypothetical protein